MLCSIRNNLKCGKYSLHIEQAPILNLAEPQRAPLSLLMMALESLPT